MPKGMSLNCFEIPRRPPRTTGVLPFRLSPLLTAPPASRLPSDATHTGQAIGKRANEPVLAQRARPCRGFGLERLTQYARLGRGNATTSTAKSAKLRMQLLPNPTSRAMNFLVIGPSESITNSCGRRGWCGDYSAIFPSKGVGRADPGTVPNGTKKGSFFEVHSPRLAAVSKAPYAQATAVRSFLQS